MPIYGVAKLSHASRFNHELPIKEGEYFIILENHYWRYWRIQKPNGTSGFILCMLVEIINERPPIFDSMPEVIGHAMAKFEYSSTTEDELDLIEDEHLSILKKENSGKRLVMNRFGLSGWIQSMYILEVLDMIPAKPLPVKKQPNLYGIAKNSYKPKFSDDLPTREGEYLIILDDHDDCHWLCQKPNGPAGFISIDNVAIINEPPPVFDTMPNVMSYAKVSMDYPSTTYDGIELIDGEILSVIGKGTTGDWLIVKRNGSSGWIPAKYASEMDIIPAKPREIPKQLQLQQSESSTSNFDQSSLQIDMPKASNSNSDQYEKLKTDEPKSSNSVPKQNRIPELFKLPKFLRNFYASPIPIAIESKPAIIEDSSQSPSKIDKKSSQFTQSSSKIDEPPSIPNQHTSPKIDENYNHMQSPGVSTMKLQISNTKEAPTSNLKLELEKYNIIDFPKEILRKVAILGVGNFGIVNLYKIQDKKIFPHELVAVKKFQTPRAGDINELKLIARCQHPNIVQCFGCYQKNGNISIVLEFLPDGNLHEYLVDFKNRFSIRDAISIIQQIIDGMCYLVEKNIIHRDLAARNCMLMLTDDEKIVKINDFGLGRRLDPTNPYYPNRNSDAIPMYWTALECLNRESFTEKSDVWSFGVLIWEIFARKQRPYIGLDSPDALVSFLEDGNRLNKPPECPNEIYTLISSCWAKNRHQRPTFDDLDKNLQAIIDELIENNVFNSAVPRSRSRQDFLS